MDVIFLDIGIMVIIASIVAFSDLLCDSNWSTKLCHIISCIFLPTHNNYTLHLLYDVRFVVLLINVTINRNIYYRKEKELKFDSCH